MPTFGDPERNRSYMAQYMRDRRLRQRLERAAHLNQRRTAFLERERQLRLERRDGLDQYQHGDEALRLRLRRGADAPAQ